MGGGSKSKSTSQSFSGSSNPAFQPYAIEGVGNVNSIVSGAQPGLNSMVGTTQNTVVPSALSNFNASSGLAGQGRDYYSDVLSGKFLSGNPHIDALIAAMSEDVGSAVDSRFSVNGRYGSGAHQGVLARELGKINAGIRYGNYTDEMARMDEAAGAGGRQNTADLAGLLQALGQGAEMPYIPATTLANSLGALFSGGQEKSQSTQKGQNPIWGAIGSGIGAAATLASASDRRLKTNIELIRRDPDGLGWYRWNWKSDPGGEKAYGVIADEVKELRPQAYVPNFDGRGG